MNATPATNAVEPPGGGSSSAATHGRHRLGSVLVPGLVPIALMLLWVLQNGGYDASTWSWGALLLVAELAAVLATPVWRVRRLSRATIVALAMLALYVTWSYASIAWAQSPGDALQGSNRALLYLLVFTVLAVLPWKDGDALTALLVFVLGLGLIAVEMLFRLAATERVGDIIVGGRLLAPTGYFNSSVALFMIVALAATALAAPRRLPAPARGLLLAFAAASLQLAVLGESRGWLFTLPFVLLASCAVLRERTRFLAMSAIPILATLVPLHRLLAVYRGQLTPAALDHAAARAGSVSLWACGGAFIAGTLWSWADSRIAPRRVSPLRRNLAAAIVAGLALAAAVAGATVATHGHPVRFVKRQWHGFTHVSHANASGSYFATVGSGRYDFWRVSLQALKAHPLGGLGQDNFADYYIRRRRTGEEPAWTHSLEMRLLAHTGIVGFLLFAGFLIAALTAALRPRLQAGPERRWIAGAAMLPLVVWLIHGSLDWFWEIPAISGPAFGFLAIATALGRPPEPPAERRPLAPGRRAVLFAGGFAAVAAITAVLGFPYLSAREVSAAMGSQTRNPLVALNQLRLAAELNPLSALPGRLGGTIALQTGQFTEAERRFSQSTAREPGGWFSWLGDGLAASQLGQRTRARHDFAVAASISPDQPAVTRALARVNSSQPLEPDQALALLQLHH